MLTDEISYCAANGDGYLAYGTPFAGELGERGEPVSAPVAALFRLDRGADNRHERLDPGRSRAHADAEHPVLRHDASWLTACSTRPATSRRACRRSGCSSRPTRACGTRSHERVHRARPKLAARKVGGEMVILSAEDSGLFVLNAVGTSDLGSGRRPHVARGDRGRAMSLETEVDAATARRDVEECVHALATAGVFFMPDEARR